MASIDPNTLHLHGLFLKVAMFRLNQANPNSDQSTTVRRDVSDRLVAILDAFAHSLDPDL
jgi:hypothetical protein